MKIGDISALERWPRPTPAGMGQVGDPPTYPTKLTCMTSCESVAKLDPFFLDEHHEPGERSVKRIQQQLRHG